MSAMVWPCGSGVTADSFGLPTEEGPLAQGAFC